MSTKESLESLKASLATRIGTKESLESFKASLPLLVVAVFIAGVGCGIFIDALWRAQASCTVVYHKCR